MKFLPPTYPQTNIIPLNFIYDRGEKFGDDVLSIVFKNMDTSMKYVHQIKQPKIEIYILKEHLRESTPTVKDWCKKSDCDVYQVPYMSRFAYAKRILKLPNDYDMKQCPWIFNIDTEIENFYALEFYKEYPYDGEIKLQCGYLDIESDIINGAGVREYGKAPTNAINFIDYETKNAYSLILCTDDLPHVSESHPQYQQIEDMRANFYKQIDDFKANIDDIRQELVDAFEETYGKINYNILLFDQEADLHKTIWEIIHLSNLDFLGAWNSPYDFQNLMSRPEVVGVDAHKTIIEKEFRQIEDYSPKLAFYEDMNVNAHKRKHKANFFIKPVILDYLVSYAGIRAGRGKIPSLKLNAIAEKELGDKKLNFGESGDIRTIYYKDFKTWFLYGIKDTLLLSGIDDKTKDTYIMYDKLHTKCTMYDQAFTTTKFVLNVFNKFIDGLGYVLGVNKNKGFKDRKVMDFREIIGMRNSTYTEEELAEMSEDIDEFLLDFEDEDVETDDDEREKFDGAFVMNPEHISSTGHKIMGRECKYVHDNVVDQDITSEYPSAATSNNMCNETQVAKVFIDDEDEINIPIPKAFEFKGKEKEGYKLDKSNYFLETITTGSPIHLGELYMDMPPVNDIIDGFAEFII